MKRKVDIDAEEEERQDFISYLPCEVIDYLCSLCQGHHSYYIEKSGFVSTIMEKVDPLFFFSDLFVRIQQYVKYRFLSQLNTAFRDGFHRMYTSEKLHRLFFEFIELYKKSEYTDSRLSMRVLLGHFAFSSPVCYSLVFEVFVADGSCLQLYNDLKKDIFSLAPKNKNNNLIHLTEFNGQYKTLKKIQKNIWQLSWLSVFRLGFSIMLLVPFASNEAIFLTKGNKYSKATDMLVYPIEPMSWIEKSSPFHVVLREAGDYFMRMNEQIDLRLLEPIRLYPLNYNNSNVYFIRNLKDLIDIGPARQTFEPKTVNTNRRGTFPVNYVRQRIRTSENFQNELFSCREEMESLKEQKTKGKRSNRS